MFRYGLTLWFVATLGLSGFHGLQHDIEALLSLSEELYYDAKFKESIELLTSLDDSIQSETDPLPQKVHLKLQLALGYLALNDVKTAKAHLAQMCVLDPNCSIDVAKYPPKVVRLFEEARADQEKNQCHLICDAMARRLTADDPGNVSEQPFGGRCGCVHDVLRNAAEQRFQDGMEAYTADKLPAASESFRDALKLYPNHVLAAQYLTLTKHKVRLTVEQKFFEWRIHFESGDVAQAGAGYRDLVTLNMEGTADPVLEEIRTAYRKTVAASLDAWSRACKNGDTSNMDRLRRDVALILPDPVIAQDFIDQMSTCTAQPCIRMDVQTAMLRVRNSTKPEIPLDLQKSLQNPLARTVLVEARIEENGDVSVLTVRGESIAINDAVRRAVEKWKFSPAIIENESRCAETVFPIVITP